MRAFDANRYINKVMLIKITKSRRIGIIVEIAGYDNPCTIIERIDRIYSRNQLAGYLQAVGTRNLFAATPARRMQYKDMERIIIYNPPRSVENISLVGRVSGSGLMRMDRNCISAKEDG